MPKIPFQPAQTGLPVRTSGGHVSQQDTGMPQLGSGFEVLANQLNSFQQQKDAAEATRQLSNAETALATTWGGIKDKWENGIQNWDENLPKVAQEDLDNLKKVGDSITNEKARLQFQTTLAHSLAGAQIEINGYQNKLQINQGVADSNQRIDTFQQLRSKTLNPDEKKGIDQIVIGQINRDKESGILNPIQAQDRIEKYQQFSKSDDVISTLDGMTYKYGAEATLNYLNDPKNRRALEEQSNTQTVGHYHEMLRATVAWEEDKKNKAKKQLGESQDANYRSQIVKFYTGEFNPNETLSLIASEQITPTQGKQLLDGFTSKVEKDKREKTDEQKKELGDISYLNYSQLLKKVKDVGSKGNAKDIDAMQNNINEYFRKDELSEGHAKQLTEALYTAKNTKDPTNDPRIKDKLSQWEKLHNAGVKVKGTTTKIDDAIEYTKKHDELIDWARAHPQATTKEIDDYFDVFLHGKKKEVSKSILQRMFGGGEAAQPKPDIESKISALKQPDPSREKAIKFLKDNGKVVNEDTIKMVIGKVK